MDREELIQIFVEEAEELISLISSSLLALEKDPTNNQIVKELFRPVHTLKGSSGSFLNLLADTNPDDFSIPLIESIATLAHSFESLISEVRDNGHLLNDDEIELLFSCEEKISELFESLDSPDDVSTDISDLLNKLALSIDNKYNPSSNKETTIQFELNLDESFVSASILLFYNDFKNHFGDSFQYSFSPAESDLAKLKFVDFLYVTFPIDELDTVSKYLSSHNDIISFKNEFNLKKQVIQIDTPLSSEEADKVPTITDEPIDEITTDKPENYIEPTDLVVEKKAINLENPPTEPIKKSSNSSPSTSNTPSIKVNIERVDDVLKHVSNLVILKNKLFSASHIDDELISLHDIRETSDQISQTVEFLQSSVMNMRMTPLEQLFSRFPKYVRKTAKENDKDIDFITLGGETEMDKVLLDKLSDPLMHLIRNSIDHGIETADTRVLNGKSATGTVTLSAKHDQGNVIITIEDDGAGINTEKVLNKAIARGVVSEEKAKTMSEKEIVNLIFHAGLSTAEKVTAISGRGVGMDVVKNNIVEFMKGQIEIESVLGVGTKTIIKLPLTLAIINAMLTKINNDVYSFPSSQVESVEEISPSEIKTVANNEIFILKEKNLEIPIIRLNKFFGIPSLADDKLNVVVIKTINNYVGLTVDEFIGHEDIVLKTVGSYLGNIPGIGGCNVLGNGEISLIVDVNSIISTMQLSQLNIKKTQF